MAVAEIVVVVPAHDEEELLPRCLTSLVNAAQYARVPVEVLVVADACSDRTAAIARQFGRLVEVDVKNVGAARRMGFEQVRRTSDTWLATTDADSEVPVGWFAAQLHHAAAGVELVAGTVRVDNWSGYLPDKQRLYEWSYGGADPETRIHGCNLAFRGTTYWALGGFAPLPLREDVALVTRFVEAGANVVWTDESPVVTSARRTSRLAGGFAQHLADMESAL